MNRLIIFLCGLFFFFQSYGKTKPSYVDYVNPLTGTQSTHDLSAGNLYPAIAVPWGMNFWTPQTGKMGDGWTYTYTENKIRGFKQTHQPSPWINDYGQFSIMWLRDSGAQVYPYIAYAKNDKQLKQLLAGVINRQWKCINIDPYANAFNMGATGSDWDKDETDMKPELHERKWEIDSLCYPLRLAYQYWKETGDASVFDEAWIKAINTILKTFKEQQRKEDKGPYHFARVTDRALDTVTNGGWGNPVKPVGLICSTFRPSDDATTFQFLVPSNFFAVSSLRKAAEILTTVNNRGDIAEQCTSLANEVETALHKYAIYDHPKYGKIYAFEVDGFGNQLLMDDANVPSLLSMAYLGTVDSSDPIYQNTRRFVWSEDNPYFFKGKVAEGIGGPHIGYDMECKGDTLNTLSFDLLANRELLVKVALSPVSVENAKQNMQAELSGWNFGATVAAADKAWNEQLSRVIFKTKNATDKKIFYTALYHTMQESVGQQVNQAID